MNDLSVSTDDESGTEAARTDLINWRSMRANARRVREIPINALFPDAGSVMEDARMAYGGRILVGWLRNHIVCSNGFKMSVQDSPQLYTVYDDDLNCTHVEVGYPSQPEPLLMDWAEDDGRPTDTVYGRVPIGVVLAVVEKHGGRARWLNPRRVGG